MKKKTVRKIANCFCFMLLAATINTKCEAEEIIYGEMKDGFFIRTYYEEYLTIPYEYGTPEYETELKKLQEARWLDELTPQMKEAGYVLINGVAYPPEEIVGEMGEGQNTEITEDNIGYLTISTQISEETTGNFYVEVARTDDGYQTYSFSLYSVNDYSTSSIELPAGHYEMVGGGLEGDVTSLYKVSGNEFDINVGKITILPLTISKSEITDEAKEFVTQIKEEEKATQELEKEKEQVQKQKSNFTAVIISLVITVAIIFGIVIFWKRRK